MVGIIIINLLIGLLVYYPALFGFFLMDDFFSFYLYKADSLAGLVRVLPPIKTIPFRPIPQQLYLNLFSWLFGFNPLPFHIFAFLVHIFNGLMVFKLAKYLFKDKLKAGLLSLLWTASPIFFTSLYSVVNINFLLGGAFFFISSWLWIGYEEEEKKEKREKGKKGKGEKGKNYQGKSQKLFYFSSLLVFGLGLLSMEITACLPLFIFLFLTKRPWRERLKLLSPYIFLSAGSLVFNLLFAGEPATETFAWSINAFPGLFRWYILRGIGLPAGIRNGYFWEKAVIFPLFGLLVLISLGQLWLRRQELKKEFWFLLKLGLWVLAASLIFYFMPNHFSPIYFYLSFLGILLFLGRFFSLRALLGYVFIFILMAFFGVRLLAHSHWMVRRSGTAKKIIQKTLKQYPQPPQKIVLNFPNQASLDDARISLQGDKAFRLFYNTNRLEVIYQLEKQEEEND